MQPNAITRAKLLFEQITASNNAPDFLRNLIASETSLEEKQFVEFKGGHVQIKNGDLQSLWAKNLSGFANSEGGVLIFGIDAPDGKAKGEILVPDAEKLAQILKNQVGSATEPPVQGIEVRAYKVSDADDSGFVVCHIPASPWRPHQVRVGEHRDKFFVRAADNCVPCGVGFLRQLFAPQSVAILEVHYKVTSTIDFPTSRNVGLLNTSLSNLGPATASDIYVRVDCRSLNSGAAECDHRIWTDVDDGRNRVSAVALRPLHPGQTRPMFAFRMGFLDATMSLDAARTFSFSVSARDQAPIHYSVAIDRMDLSNTREGKAILIES